MSENISSPVKSKKFTLMQEYDEYFTAEACPHQFAYHDWQRMRKPVTWISTAIKPGDYR